ncbi:MAG: ATP-binding protein [Pseudomonadota bacterium]
MTLKSKITVAVSTVVVILMSAVAYFMLSYFEKQLKVSISQNQFVLVTGVAGAIDKIFSAAQSQLTAAAFMIPAAAVADQDRAQEFLDSMIGLQRIFDDHVSILTSEGKIFAESPFFDSRRGFDLSFRRYYEKTVATMAPVISDPYISSLDQKHRLIMMTAPIVNEKGVLIGILAGAFNLMGENSLQDISQIPIGRNGYLYLTTRETQLVIMHPDDKWILKPAPLGTNPLYDRAIDGFEGTGETVNAYGVPMLSSFKHLKTNGWILAANYPVSEAHEIILALEKKLFLAAMVGIIGILILVFYLIKYFTSPLITFTRHIETLPGKVGADKMLDIQTHDEIGTLCQAFNQMIGKLDGQKEALLKSEERFSKAFRSSPASMVITDIAGRIIDANERWLRMTGYSWVEISGRTTLELKIWPDVSVRAGLVSQLLRAGTVKDFPCQIMTKSADVLDVLWSAEIISLGGAKVALSLVYDNTEKNRAEKEQEKLQAQLLQAQKMESVGRLAGGVAHDYNNMLGVIIGHTELAMLNVDEGSKMQRHLQGIMSAAQRSSELTQQLLAFARRQTIAPKVLDLNILVATTLNMVRVLLGEKIEVVWLPGAESYPIKIDPVQFNQLLMNLCVNARDAIVGDGRINIETQRVIVDKTYCVSNTFFIPGDYAMLVLSDNGAGMDKKTQERIFEPFFTTKGAGKGTGLGLSTVYGIVKQNNGFINVYSEPGEGTAFRIYFPYYAGSVVEMRKEEPPSAQQNYSETILVVEDEITLLEISTTMLADLGYKVLAASKPTEAIRLGKEHAGTIDLLMTDVVMPEMNGRELEIHILKSNPKIKCLFTSGYTANVITHDGVLDADVQFIQKPFTLKELALKVRESLNLNENKRETI